MARPLVFALVFFLFLALISSKPFLQWRFPLYFSDLIIYYGDQMEIDPFMLAAMIQVESGFRPEAISLKGAVGLMQIMPDTAKWLAEKQGIAISHQNLINPECNIRLGAFYFQSLLAEFPTEYAALAAYNGGPNNARRWLDEGIWDGSWQKAGLIPFSETRLYVRKVAVMRQLFRYLYRGQL